MYEANCTVVLVKDLLRCGVALIDISDGNSAYCFFDRKSLVTPVSDKERLSVRVRKGDTMKINAWLLDENAKIPYLASTIWMPGIRVSSSLMDSILTLPDMRHMEKFHNLSREMAWQLDERKKDVDVRGGEDKLARVEHHHVSRSKPGRYEELERPGLGLELDPIPQPDQMKPFARGRGKQMAIGRNVFIDSDEEEKNNQERGRGRGRTRGRGRAMAIGRNVFVDDSARGVARGARGGARTRAPRGYGLGKSTYSRKRKLEKISKMYSDRIHRGDTPEEVDPGEEELEDISSDDDGDSGARSEINPPATTSRISYPEKYIGGGGNKVPEELLVTVMEYPCKTLMGVLQGPQNTNILFHINQVWVNHSSAGFCPFREIYPTTDLFKHFYIGKVVKCFARAVRDCSKVSLQATAVWIEGDPPQESLERAETEALLPELDFHLRAYLSSSYWQLSTPPEFQKGHPAVIQEYISHEMGLARLKRGDKGVVLFHLDHIWHLNSGQWGLYKDVQKYPLSSHHLPIGTNVMVAWRKLSCSQNSRLRYQATAMWHQDECQGMVEGSLPSPYVDMYVGHVDNNTELVKSLDVYHDNIKRLCDFQLRSINPVPAILNLLPEDWSATVCKIVDADYGIIKITHRKDEDMSGAAGLNVRRMFAIFHVEDVYNISGDPFRSPGFSPLGDLLNYPVDLTARSIVDEVSGPGVLNTIAKQIILPAQFAHVACPVLQAVSVFMKPQQNLEVNTGSAPVPTFLRKCPESFHKVSSKHPSTAFYLNIVLQMKLDVKALNFFSTVTANKLQNEINNGLAMAFFNKTKKNITVDKQDQMKLLKEMSILDPNHKERLIYGSFKPFHYPPVPHAFLAPVIQATPCYIQLLCREGLAARSGIVRFNLPNGMTTYSFFDTSSYKFSLQREARVADMAELMQVCSNENFMFTGMLINPGSQIPYACTSLWKVSKWTKEPECALRQMDSRFVQKYGRVTSQIVEEWTSAESPKESHPALPSKTLVAPQYPGMSSVQMSSSVQPKMSVTLPTPVPIVLPDPIVRPPPRQVWATEEKIINRIGRVTSIIDGNYGLAVVKYRPSEEVNEIHTAIVLFDTCDLWLSADLGQPQVASNLGVSISDVMTERDHVKLNAIMVPESDNQKNIRYIATSLITDTDKMEIRRRNIPEMAPIENLDQIHPEKINNFYAVVSAICQNIPGEPEDEVKDVSSDEAEIDEMVRTKALAEEILRAAGQAKASRSEERLHGGKSSKIQPVKFKIASSGLKMNSSQPKREFLDEDFLSTAAHLKSFVSLDAFEAEREKKKLAKKNECLQTRRKMGYSREAREILLEEMKLRNQLLWNCDVCHVTMGKEAMDAHIKNNMHWDNIEDRYSKALDSIEPPNARDRKEALYLMEMGNKINVN